MPQLPLGKLFRLDKVTLVALEEPVSHLRGVLTERSDK